MRHGCACDVLLTHIIIILCSCSSSTCSLFAYFHFIQWLALTIALSLAIRPGVTDEALNYYNTPLDGLRGFVEGVVILMWMVKIGNELHKIIV